MKPTRTQDQCISKELLGETNTPDQAKDWHFIDPESDDTTWALLVRSRGDPRPPARDGLQLN